MGRARILVVDDELDMLEVCRDILRKIGDVDIRTVSDGPAAVQALGEASFDLLIADIRMPGMTGVQLLERAREHDPNLPALMMTAFPTVETAVDCMKLGASDYVIKPFLPDDLLAASRRLLESRRLREENVVLRRQLERDYGFDEMIGESASMQAVFDLIRKVGPAGTDVLVVGDTGTGKELVARSIHARSGRADGPFVPVDCGAIPESLMESEFFGHERGAFTGAEERSLGLLELADGGTFFLDEVAELSAALQAKLLRAIQERTFRRVGGQTELAVDVRILAATARDLEEEIRRGRFRDDFYYRINVVRVELPPLRERAGDIPLLVDHFVSRFAKEMGRPVEGVEAEALEVFASYPWPGNVRELQNVIRGAIALASGTRVSVDDLPDEIVARATGPSDAGRPGGYFALRRQKMEAFEKEYLKALLDSSAGDTAAAARAAEVPRGTLYRLLKKHGMKADDFRR